MVRDRVGVRLEIELGLGSGVFFLGGGGGFFPSTKYTACIDYFDASTYTSFTIHYNTRFSFLQITSNFFSITQLKQKNYFLFHYFSLIGIHVKISCWNSRTISIL